MYYGMYLSAAGAFAQNQRLEVISNNVANAGTAGFKRELGVLQSRASADVEDGRDYIGSKTRNDVGGGVQMAQTITDFRLGPLKHTGVDSDFAIDQPDVFFAVRRGRDEFLTRAGAFHFTSEGRLVNDHGDFILGADNAPIQIDPALPWSTTNKGEIVQEGDARPLALKRPTSLGDLVRKGDNFFQAIGRAPQAVPENQRSVRAQHLEMSAIEPATEMVSLIETSRAYEANVRMIQNHDQILGSLVNRALRFA